MSSRMFSADQKAKLTQLINEGMQVMMEVETLSEGLNDRQKGRGSQVGRFVGQGINDFGFLVSHLRPLFYNCMRNWCSPY